MSFLSSNIQSLWCPFYGLYVLNHAIQCSGSVGCQWSAQKIQCELRLETQEEIRDTWFGFDFLKDYMNANSDKSLYTLYQKGLPNLPTINLEITNVRQYRKSWLITQPFFNGGGKNLESLTLENTVPKYRSDGPRWPGIWKIKSEEEFQEKLNREDPHRQY